MSTVSKRTSSQKSRTTAKTPEIARMWSPLTVSLCCQPKNINQSNLKIAHVYLLHMDDLKLYGNSGTKLQSVLDITFQLPNDIGMKYGLDKRRTVHLVKGDVDTQLGHED